MELKNLYELDVKKIIDIHAFEIHEFLYKPITQRFSRKNEYLFFNELYNKCRYIVKPNTPVETILGDRIMFGKFPIKENGKIISSRTYWIIFNEDIEKYNKYGYVEEYYNRDYD